jgi:rubrerythrin
MMEAESSSSELKNLFSILAAAEDEHLKALAELKKNADCGKVDVDRAGSKVCMFRPLHQRMYPGHFNTDRDFYLHAIREEEQDIMFFKGLAARTPDEDERNKLLMVADQERKHLNKIENIYSYVEAPRTYLAWGEFSNLSDL